MNAPVEAPLGFIPTFVNDARNLLASLSQECERRIREKLEYCTVPRYHNERLTHPECILNLAAESGIDLNDPQGIEAQRIIDFREKLENKKNALGNWSTQLRSVAQRGFHLIVNNNEGRDDRDFILRVSQELKEGLSKMDKENEQLKDVIINFTFNLFTAEYWKSQVQKYFPNSENFFKWQLNEKSKTKYTPSPIQRFDMLDMRTKIYDEFARFERPLNVNQDLVKEIQARKDLKGKINIITQKNEELSQELENEREKLRSSTLDKQQLQQIIKEMEKKKENAMLLTIRSLVLASMANFFSLCLLP